MGVLLGPFIVEDEVITVDNLLSLPSVLVTGSDLEITLVGSPILSELKEGPTLPLLAVRVGHNCEDFSRSFVH